MKKRIRDTAVFGFLGALMFASKIVMEAFPNIHLLGVFIVSFTLVYRSRALFPIYIFVALQGLFSGFATWWVPYTYIWLPLWGAVMLLPKNMPKKIAPFVYMTVSGLHGLLFGILYTPAQALLYGFSFDLTVKWVIAGLYFDAIHGVSNFLCGTLIVPVTTVLRRLEKRK